MPIPENQLERWSQLGEQARSQRTHESIRAALAQHRWPTTMGIPNVYLQGSYRNHTNIRRDSDVDIVVETSNVFYSNLSPAERRSRGFQPGKFSWKEFRTEVYRALIAHYGDGNVKPGNKCLHVNGGSNRFEADVVPCCEYRNYRSSYEKGITFWTSSGVQVINFPGLHYVNGTRKNDRCNGQYKRMIRVYKNARNETRSGFPSYFLECLLCNINEYRYIGNHDQMFEGILRELWEAKSNGSMASWPCQNGQQLIFGNATFQIDLSTAHRLVDDLVKLWNNW